MSDSFVHLHVHTEYSIKDSIVRIKDLAAKAADFKMHSVAMTDHGNLFGAIEFYQQMIKSGIKPILGSEIYLAPTSLHHKKDIPGRSRSTHLTLLAKNNVGWNNLTKLISVGHIEGDYFGEPRVDREQLQKFSEGIICLSGCDRGPIHEWLNKGDLDQARATVAELIDIFGQDDFYIELMDHSLESQASTIPQLCQLAAEFNLKVVATNDVHFINKEEHEAHDVLICIGEGCLLVDENRTTYSEQVYFKSPEEMRELFKDIPGACDTTLEIAEKCNVELVLDPTSSEKYPQFESPDGTPRDEYFRKVCYEGLEMRYGQKEREELKNIFNTDDEGLQTILTTRLDEEINTITKLGFASYFLITADFIVWALDHNIPVGPGRGSAAGSLVAYCMRITAICPMRFGLLFERFLNPERVSPPDVDIDFCQTRRPEVIDYVRKKYGERCVCNIITYGTLGAKSVIRDVGRVMGVGYSDTDRLAKLIEAAPGVKLKDEFDAKEEIRDYIDSSTSFKELWHYALKLEGLKRNTGVHAAGVVIGDGDLDRHVPLARAKEGEIVSQADMSAITYIGLLKMDFLGLKNLTIIQEAVNHIRLHTPDFDITKVPLDDKPALALLNRGETMGIFQLESGGMVDTCKKYGINKIEDIIDLLAVYRPGAMQYIDEMIAVKKGIKKVVYEHPLLEKVCGDTYGVMIYQEQVQNAAKVLAGYSLGGADILRRAMGKKNPAEMAKQEQTFIEGALEHNKIPADVAKKIFEKIAGFAGYGFNKSHSACYGHISYWTAYLKANFPVEFMSGLISNVADTDKIGIFIAECHRMRIEILPPDLNRSQLAFSPERLPSGKMAIRYGLASIKNVGEGPMSLAIAERNQNGPFLSLEELCSRLDSKVINKRILENLIKAGALDWTDKPRATMALQIEQVIAAASSAHKDKAAGQVSLFDSLDYGPPPVAVEEALFVPEWSKDQKLENEKELLGFYISGHPLDSYRGIIDAEMYTPIGSIDELDLNAERKSRIRFAGIIKQIEHKSTKAGKPFGVIHLEDFTGTHEILAWSESYSPAREQGLLEVGKVIRLFANIQLDERSESRRVTGSKIEELKSKNDSAANKTAVNLTLWTSRHSEADLLEIKSTIKNHPGKTPVLLHIQNSMGDRVTLPLNPSYAVRKSAQLDLALAKWLD